MGLRANWRARALFYWGGKIRYETLHPPFDNGRASGKLGGRIHASRQLQVTRKGMGKSWKTHK